MVEKQRVKSKQKEQSDAKILAKDLKREAKERAQVAEKAKRLEARYIRENWFKLDNAALIYPAIGSTEWNSVFRISAIIKDKVDAVKLQTALDDTLKRYPFFNVSLCDGLFWHYFQILATKPKIEPEVEYPCRPFEFSRTSQIFRVLYYDNKISFETFHSLTDGNGAIRFFNTLLVRYFELNGLVFDDLNKFDLNVRDLPVMEEMEDAFKRYAEKGKTKPRSESVAFAVKGPLESLQVLKVVTGIVDVDKLKALSKSYDATINEFLSAVYLKVLIEEKKRDNKQSKRPVKLSVPVNMRRFYPSKTMRNFAQFINIEIPVDKEDGTFAFILDLVKNQSKNFNKDYLKQIINANVKSERNFFVRIMPLAIKDAMLKLIYNRVGERQFTSTLTNLGICELPEKIKDKIINYHVVLGATKLNRINLTAISFNGKCSLTFTTRLVDMRLIRDFFTRLSQLGLQVDLISNI